MKKAPRSLVRQYVAFTAAVVAVLSLGAFHSTSDVMRRGLREIFQQRFVQAERVLEEYGRSHDLASVTELRSVLGSPRFLAALETGDPATVENLVPTHPILDGADFLRIRDHRTGVLLFDSTNESLAALLPVLDRDIDQIDRRYVAGDAVYEVLTADIWANNGALLGRLEITKDAGATIADDLRRLTGLEAILVLDGRIVDRTRDGGVTLPHQVLAGSLRGEAGVPTRQEAAGEEFLAVRLPDVATGADVLFLGSVDAAVSPTMKRIRTLLIALAFGGGLVATAAAAAFTNRRVGLAVHRLVQHAERIAAGDLDFEIERGSSDELGYLAGELDRMREELRRGRERVEGAHRARLDGERMAAVGQMATGIIHDFKTPMAVVQGTTDLIATQHPDNERLARQCGTIQKQVERMVALARDVIEYSRGDSVLEPEFVELADYLNRIRQLHEDPFLQAGVRLIVPEGPSGSVLIDPGRMQRVIDNLLVNAREVSGVGDRVWLEWDVAADGAEIRVRDEGPGIDPEIAGSLFEPFVTAGKKNGSGLGLAISRKIVDDHGARIAVTSTADEGTSFAVQLPSKLLGQPHGLRTGAKEGAPS